MLISRNAGSFCINRYVARSIAIISNRSAERGVIRSSIRYDQDVHFRVSGKTQVRADRIVDSLAINDHSRRTFVIADERLVSRVIDGMPFFSRVHREIKIHERTPRATRSRAKPIARQSAGAMTTTTAGTRSRCVDASYVRTTAKSTRGTFAIVKSRNRVLYRAV